MSHNSAPPTMIEILVRFTYGGNDYDVVLTDKDFVGENFEAHKSLCNDASFHLGGCVSEWIKFTTTRMTFLDGNEVEHPIPWDKSALQVCVATTPIQPSDTYNYVRSFGVYFGQSYTEKVNHSQVEVTAYDYMYLINNFDVTDWYNNYAGTYPNGRAIDTFWNDFSGWLAQAVFAKYNYPTTPNMSYSPALMSVYAYKERLFWCPKPSIDSGGSIVQTDLFSGVVTAGMIIKGLAAAFGTNAYLFYPDTVGSSVKGRLYFFEIGDYAQDSVSLAPTDYFAFEYSSFDTTPYTNLRMAVYEALWKANNNEDMTYGFANNWVFNSMSNIEIIDDPTLGDDPTPLQTVAQLLLARFNNVNGGIFRPMSVTTDKYFEIGQQIVVTDTDGNVYNSIIMQRDYTGIYGKSITYTCIGTEDYFKEGDIGGENAVSGSLSDLSGKVPIEGGTSSSVASWEIKPSGVDLKKSGSSVMKIDSSGLSIDAKSIKKNGTELATVATSGSYNDLSNKPTSLPASDVYAWAKAATKPSYTASEVGATKYWIYTNATLTHSIAGYKSALEDMYSQRSTVYPEFNQSATVTAHLILGTSQGSATAIIDCNGTNYFTAFIFDYYVDRAFRLRYSSGVWVDHTYAYTSDIPTKLSDLTDDVVSGNYVKTSNNGYQTITTTNSSTFPLSIKSGYSGESLLRYVDVNNNILGYMGVAANDKPVFYGASGSGQKEIALVERTDGSRISDVMQGTRSYVLVNIAKPTTDVMWSFDLSVYAGYVYYKYHISGYQYQGSGNPWYSPRAELIGWSASEYSAVRTVYFGWSGTATNPDYLWVAVPGGSYVSAKITNIIAAFKTVDNVANQFSIQLVNSLPANQQTSINVSATYPVSWSGGAIANSGVAYANANNEIGWVAGFGSQGYLKLTGGKTSGKTGLLDVVADTWVLEGANNTSGYNKWIYHGKLGTNRFQCGTLAFSAAGSNSVTFSGAFGGTPIVSLTVQGNSNVYVRTYSLSASAMYITVSGACTVHWMAYYNA